MGWNLGGRTEGEIATLHAMPASGEELPSWLLSAEEKEGGAGREAVMEGSCPRASSSTVVHCSAATVLRKWYEKVLFSLFYPLVSAVYCFLLFRAVVTF